MNGAERRVALPVVFGAIDRFGNLADGAAFLLRVDVREDLVISVAELHGRSPRISLTILFGSANVAVLAMPQRGLCKLGPAFSTASTAKHDTTEEKHDGEGKLELPRPATSGCAEARSSSRQPPSSPTA